MPKLRHINPLGYVDVSILGREGPAPYFAICESCANPDHPDHDPGGHEHTDLIVEHGADEAGVGCLIPGEVFETTPEIAALLLEQVGNYELVKSAKPAKKAATAPTPAAVESTTETEGA